MGWHGRVMSQSTAQITVKDCPNCRSARQQTVSGAHRSLSSFAEQGDEYMIMPFWK